MESERHSIRSSESMGQSARPLQVDASACRVRTGYGRGLPAEALPSAGYILRRVTPRAIASDGRVRVNVCSAMVSGHLPNPPSAWPDPFSMVAAVLTASRTTSVNLPRRLLLETIQHN